MKKHLYSRREFVKRNALFCAGLALGAGAAPTVLRGESERGAAAILGGNPVKTGKWPVWPQWNPETDEKRLLEVVRSGVWSRAGTVDEFEKTWAKTVGTKRCLTTVNGTNALICALTALEIGAGDEVILPPYTFIACPQAILAVGAMPVFADVDPETFQINPERIEEKITERTRAIMPVHLGGCPADMPRIMEIARRHDIYVVEDACQAWLAEINGKQVGTFGNAGCYSFQNSKNIPLGEGGAIVSDDDAFMDRCYSYHNFGVPYGSVQEKPGSGMIRTGTKLRLTEYQAAIGLAQLKRFEQQTDVRNVNADYLRKRMAEIPGILPHRLYDHVTRGAYHLFLFRYKKAEFAGLSRDGFRRALAAEGIPSSPGYTEINRMPYLKHAFQTKNFRKMYAAEELDFERYVERSACPENSRLCKEEAVWFTQNMLLAEHQDMDRIVEGIARIRKNAGEIRKRLG